MGPETSFPSAFSSVTLEASDDEIKGSIISAVTINQGNTLMSYNITFCTAALPSITMGTEITATSLRPSFNFQ